MKSDIFALGCIFYELVFAKKAFLHDYQIFEYTFNKKQLRLPSLPPQLDDDRSQMYFTQLIHATLEIEFCRRPAARDVLESLNSIRQMPIPVYLVRGSMLPLDPEPEPNWKSVKWNQCWYCQAFRAWANCL
jgi:serine/threonine protein kinase